MLHYAFDRHLINGRLQLGERARQVFGRMARPLAMNNPPFQFEPRHPTHIKRNIAHLANGRVELDQIRQGLLVIRSLLPGFENKGGIRRIIRDQVRFDRRHVILGPQQLRHLLEQADALFFVV